MKLLPLEVRHDLNKYFPEKPISKTILNEIKKIINLFDFKKKL